VNRRVEHDNIEAFAWPAGPAWPALLTGAELTVVKLAPDGSEVTRYPGLVRSTDGGGTWVVVEARWTNRRVDLDGLSFVPGDLLLESFSPVHPFNVFAVHAPDGPRRGWYANVTYPSTLDVTTSPPTLFWHDLYLDVIALPDGSIHVRDEDELEEAGLARSAPGLHRAIVAAKDEIVRRIGAREDPFGLG
jgi:predicted RNA-binding protein associated with RNAse of E/G family